MLKGVRRRSKRDGFSFTITEKDILKLIGDGKCPVFGFPYNLKSRVVVDRSAALDKLIPSRGYTKKNCAVISTLANRIKTNARAEQVLQVYRWMKRKGLK
jgi:hypothetical protein